MADFHCNFNELLRGLGMLHVFCSLFFVQESDTY